MIYYLTRLEIIPAGFGGGEVGMRHNLIHGPNGTNITVTDESLRLGSLIVPIIHTGVNTTYGLDTGATFVNGNLYVVEDTKYERCGDIIQGNGKMYTLINECLYGPDGKIWSNVSTDTDIMACLIQESR